MCALTPVDLVEAVHARAVDMPAHEEGFWSAVAATGADRAWAGHLLDLAVEWIGAGWAEEADPYRLALSWLGRPPVF